MAQPPILLKDSIHALTTRWNHLTLSGFYILYLLGFYMQYYRFKKTVSLRYSFTGVADRNVWKQRICARSHGSLQHRVPTRSSGQSQRPEGGLLHLGVGRGGQGGDWNSLARVFVNILLRWSCPARTRRVGCSTGRSGELNSSSINSRFFSYASSSTPHPCE